LAIFAILTVALAMNIGYASGKLGIRAAGMLQYTEAAGITMEVNATLKHHPLYSIAARLQKKLLKKRPFAPPVASLIKALEQRRNLLAKSQTFALVTQDGKKLSAWEVSFGRYPQWLTLVTTNDDAEFEIDTDAMSRWLTKYQPAELPTPGTVQITNVTLDEKNVYRAESSEPMKDGYGFLSVLETVDVIAKSLSSHSPSLEPIPITVTPRMGTVINASGFDLGEMKLISTGRSNFKGSPLGRIKNIQKGLRERINNVLIPPGETFSFNDTLNAVTTGNGWYMALAIFNGGDLSPVPGGGICQVATTVFRAAINGGFDVTDRKSHSLYVHYYEDGGVGLDATVYPGQQNMKFVNDTGNYILVQAHTEGNDATVSLYGTPDGRIVAMEGPYFTTNAPEGFLENESVLRKNEIGWMQKVSMADGTKRDKVLVARYKSLPKSVVKKYTSDTIARLDTNVSHGAAGQ